MTTNKNNECQAVEQDKGANDIAIQPIVPGPCDVSRELAQGIDTAERGDATAGQHLCEADDTLDKCDTLPRFPRRKQARYESESDLLLPTGLLL
jgi:hypothetical protein